jgi:hypothetical protein
MSANRAEAIADTEKVLTSSEFPSISLLSQTNILYERQGGLYECYVPTELIDHEEVPVKQDWAVSLARQMRQKSDERGGSGQQTAIRLGWIEGEQKFRIIDGFHRDAALMLNGEASIYATVEQTDWDTLYDDRIFTAKDHAHVRFSRVVKWIQEVWEHSGLEHELTVEQAILLYRFGSDGSKLGIKPELAQKAKDWVARKEQQWDVKAMTIHSYLQTAESVDPLLVNATREKQSGHQLTAPTQQIIKILSSDLPNEFALQNIVWEEAKAHNLKGPQVKALCLMVRDRDVADARHLLEKCDIADIEPAFAETKGRQLRRAADPRHKGAAVLEAARVEIERVNLRVQQSLERHEAVDREMINNLNETINKARELQKALGNLATNIAALRASGQTSPVATTSYELDQKRVDREYAKHQLETEKNQDKQPDIRLNRNLAFDFPTYGRFSQEDWGSIEPHLRLALILEHPDIQTAEFETRQLGGPNSTSSHLSHLVKLLTGLSPKAVGPVIEKSSDGQITVTQKGRQYLKEFTKNTMLSIDESRYID